LIIIILQEIITPVIFTSASISEKRW
jgi:hypothetical protein